MSFGFGSFGGGGGGASVPAAISSIIQWLKGGTDDGLELKDRLTAVDEPTVNNVQCFEFTAATNYCDLTDTITTTGPWEIELDVNYSSYGTGSSGVALLSSASDDRWIRINNTTGIEIEGKIGDATFRSGTLLPLPATGTTYKLRIAFAGTTISVYVDGTLHDTETWGNNVESNTFKRIGRTSSHSGASKFSNFKFTNGSTVEFILPFAEGSGTAVYDISGNDNHGTLTGGTWATNDGFTSRNHLHGFRDSGGVRIPALLDGSGAADGNPITNPAGLTHNESECDIKQTETGIIDTITVTNLSGTLTSLLVESGTIVNGKGMWSGYDPVSEGWDELGWSGSNWVLTDDNTGETWTHASATGTLPPLTGWPTGSLGSDAATVSYSSFWVASEEFEEKTKAQLDAHYNTNNGSSALWIKKSGDNISEVVQFPIINEPPPFVVLRNERYFGGTSGAERTSSGDITRNDSVTNVDGIVNYDTGGNFVTALIARNDFATNDDETNNYDAAVQFA